MKSPLVLLPGLLCDGAVWRRQIEVLGALAEAHVAEYGMAASIEEMAAGVLTWAPVRFALAGHSMGGRVAFEILRQAPERVTRVALMDTRMHPKPAGEAGEKEAAGRYELLDIAKTVGMRLMGERWVQGMVYPDRLADKPLIDSILDMFERKTPAVFEAQIQALLNRPDATSVAIDITCPTLVLCGRQDAWSQLAWHEEMARAIPGARLEIVEHCGHMATMERPEAVAQAMRDWLSW